MLLCVYSSRCSTRQPEPDGMAREERRPEAIVIVALCFRANTVTTHHTDLACLNSTCYAEAACVLRRVPTVCVQENAGH